MPVEEHALDGGVAGDAGSSNMGLDSGVIDGGDGDGGGFDAGPQRHVIEKRLACSSLIGTWALDAGLQSGFGDGQTSACIPPPPFMRRIELVDHLGVWHAPDEVGWADAGCQLAVQYRRVSTNPSETYFHLFDLTLDLVPGGLRGSGTYTLSGGTNCSVPLDAVGVSVP